jgi:hypothetical protein
MGSRQLLRRGAPEAHVERLVAQAKSGDLASALTAACASAGETTSPAQALLHRGMVEAALPRGWERRLDAWRLQLGAPLLPDVEVCGLVECMREECAQEVERLARKWASPAAEDEDGHWDERTAHLRSALGQGVVSQMGLGAASRHLSSDEEAGLAAMRALLGLDESAQALPVSASLTIPLTGIGGSEWSDVLGGLRGGGETLTPATRPAATASARRELVRALGSKMPLGPVDIVHPSKAIGVMVRDRVRATGRTKESLEKETGCSPAMVRKLMTGSISKRRHGGGGRAASLMSVRMFCAPLEVSPEVAYLCGITAELPGAKRRADGALRGERHADSRESLRILGEQGAPAQALRQIMGYVTGSAVVAEGDTSYWAPFNALLAWEAQRLSAVAEWDRAAGTAQG